jgi:hypothetical protein
MTTLRELSMQASALAVQVAQEHHAGQEDPYVKARVEEAIESLLKAKAALSKAHRHLYGDEPISGVA